MKTVTVIEKQFARLHAYMPHLPARLLKWLVDNAWILALLSTILIVVGLFASIPRLISSISVSSRQVLLTSNAYYYDNVSIPGEVSIGLVTASFVLNAIILTMAVFFLKDKDKRGWDLAFVAYLISMICYTAGGLVVSNVVLLMWAAVEVIVGGYLMFEVREHFTSKSQLRPKKARAYRDF